MELVPEMEVWTMINNKPEKFKVFKVYAENERFPNVALYSDCRQSIISRWKEQIFRTKEELKEHVFPSQKL